MFMVGKGFDGIRDSILSQYSAANGMRRKVKVGQSS